MAMSIFSGLERKYELIIRPSVDYIILNIIKE